MELPKELEGLRSLALDQRRACAQRADELWSRVDPELWAQTANPYLLLQKLSKEKKEQLASDPTFLSLVQDHLDHCAQSQERAQWYQKSYPDKKMDIAYFSMEFGLSEALPIYSGGLGILAGDYLKAASDLGLNVTGIGLLYQQGYFRQMIGQDGTQQAYFPFNDPNELPIERDDPFTFTLDLPGRLLVIRVYKVVVGRILLYLFDTNDPLNLPSDRPITSELYGGGSQMRLLQEIVLGLGGWKFLTLKGKLPDLCHLNEGHASFVLLAQIRALTQSEKSVKQAIDICRSKNIFTTHTPVEAGFDRFPKDLLAHYFPDVDLFYHLGEEGEKGFNMAYFAIRCCGKINAVSRLHAQVSRKLFAPLFPNISEDLIPVGYVTNGVHVPSWESNLADELWTNSCGEHRWMGTMPQIRQEISQVDDKRLWEFRENSRKKLIDYVQKRYAKQKRTSPCPLGDIDLDPKVLTFGFARRFATYKRVDLLLKDKDRLKKLLCDAKKPIQLIIAGKAHPQDVPGQKLVQEWIEFIQDLDQANIIFLADYDILLAERLVQGIDVWINTPKRPYEASGTSGMKLLVNGGVNLSILDGWWAEAYNEKVGFQIPSVSEQDQASALYDVLEGQVIDLYYDQNEKNISTKWLEKVRGSMGLTMEYSTNRMVRQYVEELYLPLIEEKGE